MFIIKALYLSLLLILNNNVVLSAKSKNKGVSKGDIEKKGDPRKYEGVWELNYYYNTTKSPVVLRKCESQKGLIWKINSYSLKQDTEIAEDRLFLSTGQWTIKQIQSHQDGISEYLKLELLYRNIDTIEPCFLIRREDSNLWVLINWKNTRECPPKFIPFADYCRNDTSYFVGKCTDGNCLHPFNPSDKNEIDAENSGLIINPSLSIQYFIIALLLVFTF